MEATKARASVWQQDMEQTIRPFPVSWLQPIEVCEEVVD
jgi:hypothetical protein